MENTKLTLQIGDITTTWESEHDDHNVEEILEGFIGCMTGHTFHPVSVYRAMKDLGDEYLNSVSVHTECSSEE